MAICVAVVFDKKFVLFQVLFFFTDNLEYGDWIITRKENIVLYIRCSSPFSVGFVLGWFVSHTTLKDARHRAAGDLRGIPDAGPVA